MKSILKDADDPSCWLANALIDEDHIANMGISTWAVYCVLARLSDNSYRVEANFDYLQKLTGCSRATVCKAISTLSGKGYLTKVRRGDSRGSSSIYELTDMCDRETAAIANKKHGISGHVYLLHAVGTSRYKIGCSSDVDARIRKLSAQSPFELSTLALIPTDSIYRLEGYFHDRFESYRVHSEWYELPDWAVDEICNYQESEDDSV